MLLNVTGTTEASAIAEAVSEGRTIRYCPGAGEVEALEPESMKPWIETQQLGPAMADALAAWLVSLGIKAESYMWFTGQGKAVRYNPGSLGESHVATLIVGFWAGWEAQRQQD